MTEKEKYYKLAIELGEIIGKYAKNEQIELFQKMLDDYKIKNQEYFKLKKENENYKHLILDVKERLNNIQFEVEQTWRKIEKLEENKDE